MAHLLGMDMGMACVQIGEWLLPRLLDGLPLPHSVSGCPTLQSSQGHHDHEAIAQSLSHHDHKATAQSHSAHIEERFFLLNHLLWLLSPI